ncbi:MAG: CxxxxCH/CxxCH domain-containing protein, partial [Proteobacteria bacterium]|nr:CxxxxCH/CxxCH domain-containing protein [Pseudomonadota bacterium]
QWSGEWPTVGRDVTADFNDGDGGCSNISCHGDSGDVTWYQTAAVACTDCHADGSSIDPAASGGEGAQGKHTAHSVDRQIPCTVCHADYPDKTAHINGIYGEDEAVTIVGWGGKWPGEQDVSADFDDTAKTCADISCHGGAGSVAWNQTGPVTCSDCHTVDGAIDPLLGNGSGTDGKHVAHVANRGIDCDICHENYPDNGNHINGIFGKIETDSILTFGGDFIVGGAVTADFADDANGTCSDISCHGGTGSGGAWYAAATQCLECHDADGIDPIAQNGESTQGKHMAHVNQKNIACESCHEAYTGKSSHMNGEFGVSGISPENEEFIFFGGVYPDTEGSDVSADFDSGSGTCSNITCHGGTGGVTWYAESTGCNACHLSGGSIDPLVTGGSGSSGKHNRHSLEKSIGCEVCHKNYPSDPGTRDFHMNGVYGAAVETVSIVNWGEGWPDASSDVSADFDSGSGACANITCHGNTGGSLSWYTMESGCVSCHEADSTINPILTGGGTSDGKHTAHVSDRGLNCENCHKDYSESPTHMNGFYSDSGVDFVGFDGTFLSQAITGTFVNDVEGSCADISCHGGVDTSGDWYANSILCTDCHKGALINPINGNGSGGDGKHTAHAVDRGINCEICHDNYFNNPNHIDGEYGKAESDSILAFGGSFPVGGEVSADFSADASGNCSDVSCHGGGGSGGAWYLAETACADCHSADSINPSIHNGESAQGKHIAHMDQQDIVCENCHDAYTDQGSHMNGEFGVSGTTPEDEEFVFFGGWFPDQAGVLVSAALETDGTCSEVSCHGGISGIDWYVETSGCVACHFPGGSIDPLVSSGSAADGKHLRHNSQKNIACEVCHENYPSDPGTRDNHMNGAYGALEETDSIVNWGQGWPDASDDVSVIFGDADGTCSTVSCHGNTGGSLTWYTEKTGCVSCHTEDSSINPMITSGSLGDGKHQRHYTDKRIDCRVCHENYSGEPTHMNGSYGRIESASIVGWGEGWPDVSDDVSVTFDDGDGTCSTISCHGNKGGSLTWTTSASGCVSCHDADSTINPIATGGTDSQGKHAAHVSDRSLPCENCHGNYPVAATHMNGLYGNADGSTDIVDFNGTFLTRTIDATFSNDAQGDCSNVSCHGNGAGAWYTSGAAECSTCHVSGSLINPLATNGSGTDGKHGVHVSDRSIACTVCHDEYYENANHIDGEFGQTGSPEEAAIFVEFDVSADFVGFDVSAGFVSADDKCSNISCHGGSDAEWYSASTGCVDCHADGTSYDPLVTGGETTAGKHNAHYFERNIECEICHNDYKTQGTHFDGKFGRSGMPAEASGTNFVAFSGNWPDGGDPVTANFNYPTDGTCNIISCHGGTGGIDWYAESVGCTACHASGSAIDPLTSGKHPAHVTDGGVDCESCHSNYRESDSHMNGLFGNAEEPANFVIFDDIFQYNGTDPSSDFSNDGCSNISCHGNTGIAIGWYSGATGCTVCHIPGGTFDPLTTSDSGVNGKHSIHFNYTENSITCLNCHNDYKTQSTHINGTYGRAEPGTIVEEGGIWPDGGSAVEFDLNDDNGTCSDTSCHGGLGSGGNWYSITTACIECHASNSNYDPEYNGAHTKHIIDKSFDCDVCHLDYRDTSATHFNLSVDPAADAPGKINFSGLALVSNDATYDNAAGTCSSQYCHGATLDGDDGADTTPEWTGTAVCGDCHDTDTDDATFSTTKSTGSHATHFDTTGKGPNDGTCKNCHAEYDSATHVDGTLDFNDGANSLDTTDACEICHSPGGSYDGVDDPVIGAKPTWAFGVYQNEKLRFGKEKWCAGCHDEDPSNINGLDAPMVIGDEDGESNYGFEAGYGYYKTGHGLPPDQTFVSSGGLVRGPGMSCEECHDNSRKHIDGVNRSYNDDTAEDGDVDDYQNAFRLLSIDGELPLNVPRENTCCGSAELDTEDFRLCLKCHMDTPFVSASGSNWNAHYNHLRDYNMSSQYKWTTIGYSQKFTCTLCHNVHGSSKLGMLRDGKFIGGTGLNFIYYNNTVVGDTSSPSSDRNPKDVTLADSTDTYWQAGELTAFCQACHGGNWMGYNSYTTYSGGGYMDYALNNDADGDSFPDRYDNCPVVYQDATDDADGDNIGDACDICPDDPNNINDTSSDSDADGIGDNCDKCPLDPNNDFDNDGVCGNEDLCDFDPDNDADDDEVCGNQDNCPSVANSDQADSDDDGLGDLCDNCPNDANPDQKDTNDNGVGNVCDPSPLTEPKIAGGKNHSLALKPDGTVWAWGDDTYGQLGDDAAIAQQNSPVQVASLSGNVIVKIAAGYNHSLALEDNGTVWSWGSDDQGQLGDDNPTSDKAIPVQVLGLTDVIDIAAGQYHSLALKSDGTVWAWGDNYKGQLGSFKENEANQHHLHVSENRLKPIQVYGIDRNKLTGVSAIAAGAQHSMALKNGYLYTWGEEFNRVPLGRAYDYTNHYMPALVTNANISNVIGMSGGEQFSIILKSDGTVWATGECGNGQCGNGTTTWAYNASWVQVKEVKATGSVNLSDVVEISSGNDHSLARKSDGTTWVWGYNNNGQLGMVDLVQRTLAVKMSLVSAIRVNAGYRHSLGIEDDSGTLKFCSWGLNDYGQLGIDSTNNETSKQEVLNLP